MTAEFPNPVSLITRFAADGGEADEILICTFNQNLPFFERHVLGPCRATGARVTVLGDITMAEHDLAAVSRANRRYYAGNIAARRSFHPKLIVVASADEATVAVGSGNLTVSGWLGNDELWTIHHANDHGASPVVAAVGDWCRRLPSNGEAVRIGRRGPAPGGDTARRCSSRSESLDVRLLDSLDRSIIDQLPDRTGRRVESLRPLPRQRRRGDPPAHRTVRSSFTRVAYQPGSNLG